MYFLCAMSLTSSEYSLQLSLYILVYSRPVVHAYETPRAFHRNIPRKLISDLPNTMGLSQNHIFLWSHFFYPFSDIIKIGMKFWNLNLHCLTCVFIIIISFHYKKRNSNTIFSYFNFLILSESASSETLGRFRSSYRR